MTKPHPEQQFTAFLSFANPDRALVTALHKLFWQLDEPTFFAPEDLPRAGSPEWRKHILRCIRKSHTFVPIYTRHSINRRWVLYESGLADACKLPRFPVRASNITHADIEDLPGPSVLVYDLSDRRSLSQFLINVICGKSGPEDKHAVEAEVRRVVATSQYTDQIVSLAKTRWVFVAGNTPVELEKVKWCSEKSEYEARLREFSVSLTSELMERGFSITACPQVESVGLQAINTAADKVAAAILPDHIDYRIAGIYPIDRAAKNIQLSESARKHWVSHIMKFRRSYLADQDWLVLVGGNQGTQDEYEAAKSCNVRAFPVPCFGGTAQRIALEQDADSTNPCAACTVGGPCNRECARKIADYLLGWRPH